MGGVLMSAAHSTPGSPCAVFLAGFKYRSIFEAADCAGIAPTWVNTCLLKSGGAPVVIKNQIVVTDFWVQGRIDSYKGAVS
jgi:hypothetical protein